MLDVKRYDRLLFDAIMLLRDNFMTDKEVMEWLEITEEEYDEIGNQYDDVCQYSVDIVSRHDESFEEIIPKVLEDAGYEVMGCTWKATWSRYGYSHGEPPIDSD